MVWSAKYKAWGGAYTQGTVTNNIRFQGQYFDVETGLHYNRYRYYDPNSGRFVSKDPIGLAGGFNLQQYGVNPIAWVDPLGLKPCTTCQRDHTCSHSELEALTARVDKAKDAVGSLGKCRSGMGTYDLQQRKAAWLEFATARSIREARCWRGGDATHQDQIAAGYKNVGLCQRLIAGATE